MKKRKPTKKEMELELRQSLARELRNAMLDRGCKFLAYTCDMRLADVWEIMLCKKDVDFDVVGKMCHALGVRFSLKESKP